MQIHKLHTRYFTCTITQNKKHKIVIKKHNGSYVVLCMKLLSRKLKEALWKMHNGSQFGRK
ncbi:hypothetical protein C7387_0842 [Yokenella regensburgei]|uniref:Uncharacterized protein n=1 Tax=Yokenella regensburgei TaxID=158877 RepID=A0ABX9S089_9ENTR|nr:hypothetical protein C7387_0842 [Yokenella regensburgei]VFS19216.1 Uncharacterised protein [Yokenella regensburgei]